MEKKNNEQNRELCDLFADLQLISNLHKIRITYPELVILGMQSDGKSSFVESLCGFQFNLVDSNIGTRRPVIIQMRNDPSQESPRCTFLKEDGYKGEEIIPVEKMAEEIRNRTNEYCGESSIRSRPIVIRISYKNASNLTVYDLPGFRANPEDPHGEYIKQLAQKICKPKNRILLCLEQSTVEYVNSQSRPIVQEFDPQLTRTIFVQTKFDNRRKQFTTTTEAEKYLKGEEIGGHKNVPIFFISLPSGVDGRNLSADVFNKALKKVHLKDFQTLLKLKVNPVFKEKIGFFRLRNFLENRLTQEYRRSVEPISRKILHLIDKKQKQFDHLNDIIQNLDKQDFRDCLDDIISDFHHKFISAISGTTMFNPQTCGMTLEEEKEKSGCTDWPNFRLDGFQFKNSSFKLYGGSQIERLISEFSVIAHSQEFPPTSSDEVAASLGLSSMHTNPDIYRAISDLSQKKCVKTFSPLIFVLFHRSRFILKHLIRIIVHYMEEERESRTDKMMLTHVRKSADSFIDEIVKKVEEETILDFETSTQNVDWISVMNSNIQIESSLNYDLLNPSPEDTLKRIQAMTNQESILKIDLFSRELTEERCRELKMVAAKLFAGLRNSFVQNIQSRYRNFFLQPLLRKMDSHLRKAFKMSNDELKDMLGIHVFEFVEKRDELKLQLEGLLDQKDKFLQATETISNLNSNKYEMEIESEEE